MAHFSRFHTVWPCIFPVLSPLRPTDRGLGNPAANPCLFAGTGRNVLKPVGVWHTKAFVTIIQIRPVFQSGVTNDFFRRSESHTAACHRQIPPPENGNGPL